MMPSTAPATRLHVLTSAARMRRTGHRYLINVETANQRGHHTERHPRGDVVLDDRPHRDRAEHQQRPRQQRHHDADQPDGDGECNEDDPAGAHGRFPRTHWMVPKLFVRTPTRPRSSRVSPISSSVKKWAPPSGSQPHQRAAHVRRWAPSRPSGRRAAAPWPSRPAPPTVSVSTAASAMDITASKVSSRNGSRCASARRKPTCGPASARDRAGQHRLGDVDAEGQPVRPRGARQRRGHVAGAAADVEGDAARSGCPAIPIGCCQALINLRAKTCALS